MSTPTPDDLAEAVAEAVAELEAELEAARADARRARAEAEFTADLLLAASQRGKEVEDEYAAKLDEVYAERAHLEAHLAALYPATFTERAEDAPEWGIVYINTPAGQMSWHVAPRDKPLFAHVPRGQETWDGHTTAVKYQRLDALTAATAEALARSASLREDQAAATLRVLTADTGRPDEPTVAVPCPHCPDGGHRDPTSRPWGVYVAPERDSDGQPVYLRVQPSNGAHVALSDAAWLWRLIRYAPSPAAQ